LLKIYQNIFLFSHHTQQHSYVHEVLLNGLDGVSVIDSLIWRQTSLLFFPLLQSVTISVQADERFLLGGADFSTKGAYLLMIKTCKTYIQNTPVLRGYQIKLKSLAGYSTLTASTPEQTSRTKTSST
jgi:hypothetical protein